MDYPQFIEATHIVWCANTASWIDQAAAAMGRKFMGILRTTYLIGPDGKVQGRWDSVKVGGHADEVLAALS